jgi:HK97 family phage portal protein
MSILFRAVPERRATSAGDLVRAVKLLRSNGVSELISRDALEVAAVVACLGLRAGAFAQLPLKGYLEGVSATQPASSQPELLRSPSDVVVPSVWKIQMSISRDLWGFALGRVTAFDAALYPKRVEWIDPTLVRPTVVGATVEWRVDGEVVDESLLVHIPSRWVMPGNPVGVSPLERSGLVDLAKRAQEFGADWFRSGAVPSAVVYSDQELDQSAADGMVARIVERWRNRQPAVLGSGFKYEQISVAANESQFLETITHIAAQVAVSFNMPPSKIGAAISGQYVSYGNRDQDQQSYVVDSINPDLVVIEESLNRHLPGDLYCKFNTGGFLRSDLKTRLEGYKLAAEVQARTGAVIYTEDEIRALEERAPLSDVDRLKAVELMPSTQLQSVDVSA